MAMNGYYGYQLHEAERSRSRTEMIDADLRLGQMAAAAARLNRDRRQGRRRNLGARLSLRFSWPGRVQEGS